MRIIASVWTMIFVVTVEEGDCVIDVMANAIATCQSPRLGRTCQCINLLVARNSIPAFISTSG